MRQSHRANGYIATKWLLVGVAQNKLMKSVLTSQTYCRTPKSSTTARDRSTEGGDTS